MSSALVGWSNGNGAADPGPRDLTAAAPFSSSGSGQPLALLAQGAPRIGQNVTLQLANTPSGATTAMLIIGNARQNPAIDLTGIGMPGCTQYVTLDASLPFAPQPGTITVAVPNNPLLAGLQVHCQAANGRQRVLPRVAAQIADADGKVLANSRGNRLEGASGAAVRLQKCVDQRAIDPAAGLPGLIPQANHGSAQLRRRRQPRQRSSVWSQLRQCGRGQLHVGVGPQP